MNNNYLFEIAVVRTTEPICSKRVLRPCMKKIPTVSNKETSGINFAESSDYESDGKPSKLKLTKSPSD